MRNSSESGARKPLIGNRLIKGQIQLVGAVVPQPVQMIIGPLVPMKQMYDHMAVIQDGPAAFPAAFASAEIETGQHKVLGDNDTLSAIVAKLCKADLLVLLSDIDGLYDADPRTHKDAKLLSRVEKLTPDILEMAGGAGTWRGTGGMATKLSAASIVMDCGCDMVITNGRDPDALYEIAEGGEIGTRFISCKGAGK